jgi:hypothetical protein
MEFFSFKASHVPPQHMNMVSKTKFPAVTLAAKTKD